MFLVAAALAVQVTKNDPNSGHAAAWLSGAPVIVTANSDSRPTTTGGSLDRPAPPLGAHAGNHDFLATQPGTSTPVTYDPCRVINVVVNNRTAPQRQNDLVADAIREVSAVSGLQFNVEGPTGEKPADDRPSFQKDRYGDRWAPVLIAWTDPVEAPELAGRVAGVGGSARLSQSDTSVPDVYVTGSVSLDGPQLTAMMGRPDGEAQVRAVIMHELGHLLGLAHVVDPTQIMHEEGHPEVVELQGGDRAGLVAVGQGPCLPEL